MLTYTILVLAFSTTAAVSEIDPADEFAVKYDYLLRHPAGYVGKEVMVEAFESFIEEFSDDPRVAEAMISLGDRTKDSSTAGTDADPSVTWYRRAADKAPAGSEIWLKAKFHFLNRLPPRRRAEGRPVLAEIAEHAKDNPVALAKVEVRLLGICREEDNLDAAERHCRNLLNFEKIHGRLPTDNFDQIRARAEVHSQGWIAISMIMAGMRMERTSLAQRAKRIKRLRDDFPVHQYLHIATKRTLEKLAGMYEWGAMQSDPLPDGFRPTIRAVPSWTFVPRDVDFGLVRFNSSVKPKEVAIETIGSDTRLDPEETVSESPWVTAEVIRREPLSGGGTRYVMKVALVDGAPLGKISTRLAIPRGENGPGGPWISVKADISRPVRVEPRIAFLGILKSGATAKRVVKVSPLPISDHAGQKDRVARVVGFGTCPPGIHLSVDEQDSSLIHVLGKASELGVGRLALEVAVQCDVEGERCEGLLLIHGMVDP